MDRDYRRDERRRPDHREHKPRYQDRDRSRSPPQRDRRDDRRRDRSPYQSAPRGGGPRDSRERDYPPRGRQSPQPPSRNSNPNSRGGRPPPSGPRSQQTKQQQPAQDVNMDPLEGEDEEATMRRIMGFEGFRSTKNTKVPGNDKNYAVSKVKKAEYRQYMNRVGGFNRPLSPSRA
ncbi:hypothetical protein KC320_g2683 [Hortaea werneckii]|nr:hypothetical protein KC320_g2683 [Hortaea werneckii]